MEDTLLLAGPILRRTERSRVCIWLATLEAAEFQAKIYKKNNDLSPDEDTLTKEKLTVIGVSSQLDNQPETVRLGEQLYITLLTIKPVDELFPKDTILFYDVIINGKNLDDLNLIKGQKGLAYPGLPLPNFFIPGKISNLLHGSCRKPHGRGKDTLIEADILVGKTVNDLKQRPAMLFLMGDQIYADDVAGPMLDHLIKYGTKLTGWKEKLPALKRLPADLPLYGRTDVLTNKANFTSGYSDNHSMTFGEYAAMYLSVWSDEPWKDIPLDADPNGIGANANKYEEELKALTQFRETLPNVRRLLANIPTYMMFDDHDVTDDWNLHRKWYNSVRANETGRRIVANALAAYWVFQGWGNSPEAFSIRFIDAISDHILAKKTTGALAKRFDQRIWGFHRWGFSLPSNPPVIALDSRTEREYDSPEGPARLIDRYGLDWIRTAWTDIGEPRAQGLILIAATPIYGYEPLEFLQKIITSFGIPPTKVDRESWIANRDGFGSLMRLLNNEIQPDLCLILSGDVHYAFSSKAEFFSDGRSLLVKQLTSSAIKNEPKQSKYLNWLSRLTERTEHRLGWLPDTPALIRFSKPILEFLVRWNLLKSKSKKNTFWTDEITGIIPKGKDGLLYTNNNLGLVQLNSDGTIEHKLLTESGDVVTYSV